MSPFPRNQWRQTLVMVYNSSTSCPCSPSKCRQVKLHLSAYNHEAHYIFCLADYMFGAMWHSHHVDPFSMYIHNVRSVDWSQHPMHRQACSPPTSTHLCTHLCQKQAPLLHLYRKSTCSGPSTTITNYQHWGFLCQCSSDKCSLHVLL